MQKEEDRGTMSNKIIIGEPLFAKDADGKVKSRIATAFPRFHAIVTLPGIHATQIDAFVEWLVRQQPQGGAAQTAEQIEKAARDDAVALTIEGDTVQIRPDPGNMPLAYRADKLLQSFVSKRRIKFLNVLNERVRDAVKRRGECWRIAPLPTSPAEMKQRISASRISIRGNEVYYYNSTTGTRLLTCREFAGLGSLDEPRLRQHLAEIREFSAKSNPHGNPEIAFFLVDAGFSHDAFAPYEFGRLDSDGLRTAYEDLRRRFRDAVEPEFREDDPDDDAWRNRMFSALIAETDDVVPEGVLLALSPEFHMQIRWLPGGRIVNGELLFDEVFEEEQRDVDGAAVCENNAREFLYNLVRSYEDLEYANVGQVVNSLSRRLRCRGRREVYIAVIKRLGYPQELVSIIRMQKWGVREHLDDGVPLLQAMFKSDEYTEYTLDRRFACHHLGMNIPKHVTTRKVCERYFGSQTGAAGTMIWSPYFRREYVPGIATDKMPRQLLQDAEFSLGFARQLGLAAAPNIIVGRRDDIADKVLFDDGDEVLTEDARGMPLEIKVADLTGTFVDYRRPLQASAAAYADPVNRRIEYLPDPEGFVRAYLDAFEEKFFCVQEKYRRRRAAFDTLFKNRSYDADGSFAYRWEQVLKRLDRTDPRELAEIIGSHLQVPVACPAS
jgi:hypothetical protein